ncbi:MAG: hypothetical protein ABSD38_13775 [Syntrophorhabdales bacterium]
MHCFDAVRDALNDEEYADKREAHLLYRAACVAMKQDKEKERGCTVYCPFHTAPFRDSTIATFVEKGLIEVAEGGGLYEIPNGSALMQTLQEDSPKFAPYLVDLFMGENED